MNDIKTLSVLLVASAFLWGCSDDDSSSGTKSLDNGMMGAAGASVTSMGDAPVDIIDTALAAGSFTQLASALTTADLVDTLKGAGPFTVFAPTDAAFDAFEAANPGVLASLSVEELTNILLYHVVAGDVRAADLVNGGLAATVQGAPVQFDLSGDTPRVIEAGIVSPDVEASNGVIHVIDSIILPPEMDIVETALAAGDFTQLANALTAADLVGALQGDGPFTVFAPTDAAFQAFEAANPGVLEGLSTEELTNVLLYHVVGALAGSGDLVDGMQIDTLEGNAVTISLANGVSVDTASVSTADILTSNGVIHVIDAVILP
jgi:uncharacterized surface protein with fasciclin (FAS1) repeats